MGRVPLRGKAAHCHFVLGLIKEKMGNCLSGQQKNGGILQSAGGSLVLFTLVVTTEAK